MQVIAVRNSPETAARISASFISTADVIGEDGSLTDRHQAIRGTETREMDPTSWIYRAYITATFTQSRVYSPSHLHITEDGGVGCGGVSPPVDSVAASDLVVSPGSNEFSPLTPACPLSLSDRLSRSVQSYR